MTFLKHEDCRFIMVLFIVIGRYRTLFVKYELFHDETSGHFNCLCDNKSRIFNPEPGSIRSDPVQLSVRSGSIRSDPVQSGQIWSEQQLHISIIL